MSFFTFTLRRSALRTAFCGTISACCALALGGQAGATEESVEAGKVLFEHSWEPNDPLSGHGDGLGPMFNARSCVECHSQAGGGGDNEHNVIMLTVVELDRSDKKFAHYHLQRVLGEIHPDFRTRTSLVLHRYSTSLPYESLRSNLLALNESSHLEFKDGMQEYNLPVRIDNRQGRQTIKFGPFFMQRSERSTPALFGDAWIDKIDGNAIKAVADQQPGAMRGTIAGRFGWHGQTLTLSEFVQGACANEMGLQIPKHAQPRDVTRRKYRLKRMDMTKAQVAALTDFVASLPPPRQHPPESPDSDDVLRRGSQLFESARCAVCHTPELGAVKGIYSDVLLHDMGDVLAEPLGTQELHDSQSFGSSSGAYYGASLFARTWRTPPLWGVRNSAPYLHDGRAETIDEAIRMHDGQGKPAADAYTALKPTEREDVVTFVKSLGAP